MPKTTLFIQESKTQNMVFSPKLILDGIFRRPETTKLQPREKRQAEEWDRPTMDFDPYMDEDGREVLMNNGFP